MSFVLSFKPGDRVRIGQDFFQVDVPAGCLVSQTGDVVALSDENTSIAPGVEARVTDAGSLPGLVLVFTAPAGTLIQRLGAENAV